MYRNLLIYILEPLQGLSYEKLAEVGKKLQEGDEENRAVGEVLFHALQTIKTQQIVTDIVNEEDEKERAG
ncbi:MAG: hypothetical protein ACYSW3_02055 [Planctomycetota bacterium]|jgi:hypothetical protein